MPPVSGHSTANHQAQRWIDSIVALKPIVQRQNSAARSRGRAAVDDLLDLALAAEAARPPGWWRRASRTAASSRTGRRSTARGTGCRTGCRSGCEKAAVQSRCGKMPKGTASLQLPISTGRMKPSTRNSQIADGEGPGHVRAHAQRPRPAVHAHPPQQDRDGQEEAGHQPPAALVQRRQRQAVGRRRRLEREPEQLADELDRVPVHRGQHVEADDLERRACRRSARPARASRGRSGRSARRRCGPAGATIHGFLPVRGLLPGGSGTPSCAGPTHLHAGEDVLVFGHACSPGLT